MYIVSGLHEEFSHTVDNIVVAKAMASTASHNYGVPFDILDGDTGEVLYHYEGGKQVAL